MALEVWKNAGKKSRHASLAWDIVEWVLSEKPELAETAKRSYEKFEDGVCRVSERPVRSL